MTPGNMHGQKTCKRDSLKEQQAAPLTTAYSVHGGRNPRQMATHKHDNRDGRKTRSARGGEIKDEKNKYVKSGDTDRDNKYMGWFSVF